jgi:hypothetical protein
MTPGDVLWIFFLFSTLQPVLKQQLLEASRQRLIARIERSVNLVSSCLCTGRR